MSFELVEPGRNFPDDFNMIVEIPTNAAPVKYEVDKRSGTIFVDRFMSVTMQYPCNYGYVPGTLAADGDPVDVLLIAPQDLLTGVVVRCRPIGLLAMEDENGDDAKVLALPAVEICAEFASLGALQDLPPGLTERIAHFFRHYKDLEVGKFVRVKGWRDVDEARAELLEGLRRYDELPQHA